MKRLMVKESVPRKQKVHIVNRLEDASGGSEQRSVALYRFLSRCADVTLWAAPEADPAAAAGIPFRTLKPRSLAFPTGGTIIIVGVYFDLGRWIYLARPKRAILVYNTFNPDMLSDRIRKYERAFRRGVELVFCSEKIRASSSLQGTVLPSLIDLERFYPKQRPPKRDFTIGRLSRAVSHKHHPDDVAFYRSLSTTGVRTRVMGATQEMISEVEMADGISFMPALVESADKFLQSIDCFFYRTAPEWQEAWGRVVVEAMACGLPVVAERSGGYAEIIKHGVNGFLFDTEAEARAIIAELKNSLELRSRVGIEARRAAEMCLSKEEQGRIRRFYLGR